MLFGFGVFVGACVREYLRPVSRGFPHEKAIFFLFFAILVEIFENLDFDSGQQRYARLYTVVYLVFSQKEKRLLPFLRDLFSVPPLRDGTPAVLFCVRLSYRIHGVADAGVQTCTGRRCRAGVISPLRFFLNFSRVDDIAVLADCCVSHTFRVNKCAFYPKITGKMAR